VKECRSRFGGGASTDRGRNQKGRDRSRALLTLSRGRDDEITGFLPALAAESAFLALSALAMESATILACDVSVAGAGAGAGAIAGALVSFAASSDFEQAVIARTAATKARRFMTFS